MDSKILLNTEIDRLSVSLEAFDTSVESAAINVLETELNEAVLKRNTKQIAGSSIASRIEELKNAIKVIEDLE